MSLYQQLFDKVALLERRNKEKAEKDQSCPWYLEAAGKCKRESFSYLKLSDSSRHLELGFYKFLLALTRIWMIIRGTPSSNFHIFTQAGKEGVYICNYSYCHYKSFHNNTKYKSLATIVVATVILSLIVALIFPGKPVSRAATVSWIQSSWLGGASALKAKDPDNRTNWTNYADSPAADANITAGATVALAPIAGSKTETADTDFNGKLVTDTSDANFNAGNYGTPPVTRSDGAGGVILVMPPSQVTGLSPTAGNTQVVLNWSAPANNGSAITSYKVYRSTTSGTETLLVAGGCSSLGSVLTCTDTGLSNGTTYYYKVSAVNTVGEGVQSSEVSAMPNTVPGQVTGLAVVGGNTQAVLNWSTPTNNGTAITSYKVYRGTTSGGESLLSSGGCSGLGSVLTCTDASLTNGTVYYYKVSAVNAAGEGAQSVEANDRVGWISGVCAGLSVYYTDQGSNTWSGAASDCSSIGGRLATGNNGELKNCIYTNRASFGTFVTTGSLRMYWSSTSFDSSSAWCLDFSNGTESSGCAKAGYISVRCVR